MTTNTRPENSRSLTTETLQIRPEENNSPLPEYLSIRGFRDVLIKDKYYIDFSDKKVFCNAIVFNTENLKTAQANVIYLWSPNREVATLQAIEEAKRRTESSEPGYVFDFGIVTYLKEFRSTNFSYYAPGGTHDKLTSHSLSNTN
jgi:hypothetical protein